MHSILLALSEVERAPPRTVLFDLPEELLCLVMMELDFKCLLRLRLACRKLNRISFSGQIWRHLFRQHVGTTIPRPFFLSKHLNDCSAEDIERDLRRWQSGWGSPSGFHCVEHRVHKHRRNRSVPATYNLLPGGMWLIAGLLDGSIWSFDLLSDANASGKRTKTPRLLVPSPYIATDPAGVQRNLVQISIDCTSTLALGSSVKSHHLERLNIAVITCPIDYKMARTRVDVWSVLVPALSDSESSLRLGERLSSFTDARAALVEDSSLHGTMVAYSIEKLPYSRYTAIVPWPEANGKALGQGQDSVRRYVLRACLPSITLLPGNWLLTVGCDHTVSLYSWPSNGPVTQVRDEMVELGRPRWMCELEVNIRHSG